MRYRFVMLLMLFAGVTQGEDEWLKSSFLTFRYENDVFLGTDQYYTQGIRLEYSGRFLKRSPINFILPTVSEEADRISVFAEQQCFTPSSILISDVQEGDHPYGGAIFLGQERASYNASKHKILVSGLTLGGLGSCAKCEETQKGIHRATNNKAPLGWGNQLSNALVINYELGYEEGIIAKPWMTLSALAGLRLGTLYDDAQVGVGLRFGRVSNAFAVPDQEFSTKLVWNVFVNGNLKFTGYNAVLQGGFFNKPDIYSLGAGDLEPLAFVGRSGLRLAFHSVVLETSVSLNTSGFSGASSHLFSTILLRYFI